jgi:hypothetical protein
MQKKLSKFDFILLAALLLLTVLSAFYFYPYAMEVPHRDSGIYLYIGSELLKGKTIYVDVWEHKPPFIFYVNALGLLLGGGSAWGIWGLEVAFLFFTLLISYKTLREKLRPLSSFLITAAVFLAAYQYMSGNFTEEYALLFQALIIFIFLKMRNNEKNQLPYFLMGILTGIVFNIKQTYIDVSAAIVIFILLEMIFHNKWKNIKLLFYMGCGFMLTNLLVVLIMWMNGAVAAWWETAYVFNFAYSDLDLYERIEAFLNLFKVIGKNPFSVMMLIVWFFGICHLLITNFSKIIKFFTTRRGRLILLFMGFFFAGLLILGQFISSPGLGVIETTVLTLGVIFFILYLITSPKILIKRPDQKPALYEDEVQTKHEKKAPSLLSEPYLLGLIDLPIVLFLVIASGRNYNHYFITFYPAQFLLFYGIVLYLNERVTGQPWRRMKSVILIGLFVLGAIGPVQKVIKGLGGPYLYNPYREVIKYVREHSEEDDTLMVWAMDSGINYLADRSAPSRYSYVDPAYYDSPLKDEAQKALYTDITTNPPLFILDMRNPDYPFIDGRTKEECLAAHPNDGTYLDKTIHFACQNYEYIDRIDHVEVYQLTER